MPARAPGGLRVGAGGPFVHRCAEVFTAREELHDRSPTQCWLEQPVPSLALNFVVGDCVGADPLFRNLRLNATGGLGDLSLVAAGFGKVAGPRAPPGPGGTAHFGTGQCGGGLGPLRKPCFDHSLWFWPDC